MSIGTSTYIPKAAERDANRSWFVVDARDIVLGKLAAKVASVLRGKHKPSFTPFLDTGDHVVVVNAKYVHVTGNKETDKLFHHHTGYLGNMKTASVGAVRTKRPAQLIEDAVRGMLPKTPLGRAMIKKLRVYAEGKHEHQAQSPKPLAIQCARSDSRKEDL